MISGDNLGMPSRCKITIIFFAGVLLAILLGVKAKSASNYARETVAVFDADKNPLGFSLTIGVPTPFQKPQQMIEGHEFHHFSVDNNGSFYLLNSADNSISVYDSVLNDTRNRRLTLDDFGRLRYFWIGPENDIYALLGKRDVFHPTKSTLKLSRFLNYEKGITEDEAFKFPEVDAFLGNLSIAPDKTIYIEERKRSSTGNRLYTSFGPRAELLRSSIASGKTRNGLEFYLRHKKEDEHFMTEGIQIGDEQRSLFIIEGDGRDYKCTFDDEILILFQGYETLALVGDKYLRNNKPFIILVNAETKSLERIDLCNEIENMGYLYKNISCVDFNYRGDIYASVIYFNVPGTITGDEKLVIYRWRKQ